MNKEKDAETQVQQQTYISGGAQLDVIVTKISEGKWSLSVCNQRGIVSTWLEYFASADAAFCAGFRTLQEEGVEEFTSIEGFEYLDEADKDV